MKQLILRIKPSSYIQWYIHVYKRALVKNQSRQYSVSPKSFQAIQIPLSYRLVCLEVEHPCPNWSVQMVPM